MRAMCAASLNCTARGLRPLRFNVDSGQPVFEKFELKSVGSGADSYYEYLLKTFILSDGRHEYLLNMWLGAMDEMIETLVRSFDLAGGERAHVLTKRLAEHVIYQMDELECTSLLASVETCIAFQRNARPILMHRLCSWHARTRCGLWASQSDSGILYLLAHHIVLARNFIMHIITGAARAS